MRSTISIVLRSMVSLGDVCRICGKETKGFMGTSSLSLLKGFEEFGGDCREAINAGVVDVL